MECTERKAGLGPSPGFSNYPLCVYLGKSLLGAWIFLFLESGEWPKMVWIGQFKPSYSEKPRKKELGGGGLPLFIPESEQPLNTDLLSVWCWESEGCWLVLLALCGVRGNSQASLRGKWLSAPERAWIFMCFLLLTAFIVQSSQLACLLGLSPSSFRRRSGSFYYWVEQLGFLFFFFLTPREEWHPGWRGRRWGETGGGVL